MHYLGVDLGGTKISFGVVNSDGKLVEDKKVSTPKTWSEIRSQTVTIANVFRSKYSDINSVGFGCAGMISPDGYVHYSPNVPAFDGGVALKDELSELLNMKIVVDNDNNCAGYGEYITNRNAMSNNVLYIGLGTGIGGAIIIDGKLVRGEHGYGGDVGHFIMDMNGPICACGNKGCFESLASGSALGSIAKEHVQVDSNSEILTLAGGNIQNIEGSHVGIAWRDGDTCAKEIIEEYSYNLAVGIIGLVNILDPGTIILGGGVIAMYDVLKESLMSHIKDIAQGGYSDLVGNIIPAQLGENSGVIGAALLGV